MKVRVAGADDHLAVMRVLDGAMLAADAAEVRRHIDAGDALVAVDEGRVLGAVVLRPREDGAVVDSVAVRRARRGQGIGTALVEAASERYGRLTAECDERVRPFYVSMGFEVERVSGDRFQGTFPADR